MSLYTKTQKTNTYRRTSLPLETAIPELEWYKQYSALKEENLEMVATSLLRQKKKLKDGGEFKAQISLSQLT